MKKIQGKHCGYKLSSKALGRGKVAKYPQIEKELVEKIAQRWAAGLAISTKVIGPEVDEKKYPEETSKASQIGATGS